MLIFVCLLVTVLGQTPIPFAGTTYQAIPGGNGVGGGFKINTNGNWMSLQVDSLCEYNGNVQVQCADLKKHSFGWGTSVITANIPQINGNASNDNFQQNSVTVTLDNGAIFSILAWLVSTDAKNSDAKKGDVKWTYTIQNWPWASGQSSPVCTEQGCTGGGSLCLLAGLDGFGGIVNGGAGHAVNGAGTAPAPYSFTVQGVTYQNGFLNQPSQALCDGNTINVQCGHTLQGSGKPRAQWCFDYCAGQIVYDPVTGGNPGGGGSNAGGNGNSNKKTSNPGTVVAQTGAMQANADGSFGVSTNGNWAGLQWATLTEYDATGTPVQSVDLTKTHFGWSQPDIYTVVYSTTTTVSEKMPHVNFTSTLVNGAIFIVDAYFFNVDSVVSSNKRNDIKFTITIENWPWSSSAVGFCNEQGFCTGGTLVLTAGLVGYGGIVRHYIHTAGSNGGDLVQADFTFATLVSPDFAVYDPDTINKVQPVAINYTLSGKPEVMWTFQYFQSKVIFDPTLSPSSPSSPAAVDLTSPGFITLWAILGLLTIGGLIIGITFTLSRGKQRRESKAPQSSSEVPL